MSEITIRYDGAINSWTVEVDGLGVVFHATERADVALFAAKLRLYDPQPLCFTSFSAVLRELSETVMFRGFFMFF